MDLGYVRRLTEKERLTSDEELEEEFFRLLSQKTVAWEGGCENSLKEVRKEKDNLSQKKEERCPACGKTGQMIDDAERGEVFCGGCGTVFQERGSVVGAASDPRSSVRPMMPKNLGLGELPPKRNEYESITNHPTGRTETNIIASQYSDGEKELNAIREMAESAAKWLALPRNAEVLLVENTVGKGTKLLALLRAGGKRVSLERLTAYSLLSEAKKLGKSIGEVQSALARAQFKIPLLLITIYIATATPEGVSFLLACDSSSTKQPLNFKMSKRKNEDSRTVELVSAYDLETSEVRSVKLNIELSDVLAVKSDVDFSRVSKFLLVSENALIREGPDLVESTCLEINPSKCFALFKRAEEILSGERISNDNTLGTKTNNSPSAWGLDVEKFAKARLPSRFPISSMLMREAGCLQKMEIEYMNTVKRLVSSPENIGRTPSRLMLEALRTADRSIFQTLSPEIVCRLGIKAAKLGLISGKRKKRKVTSFDSFLIAGEVR
jgi:ribosomal protein S27AE